MRMDHWWWCMQWNLTNQHAQQHGGLLCRTWSPWWKWWVWLNHNAWMVWSDIKSQLGFEVWWKCWGLAMPHQAKTLMAQWLEFHITRFSFSLNFFNRAKFLHMLTWNWTEMYWLWVRHDCQWYLEIYLKKKSRSSFTPTNNVVS